jgi:hypothetical protein
MKKISNTIRIGVHRRGNLSAKFNERQSSSLNVQEQANHQPVREQTNHQPVREQTNHQPVREQTSHQLVREQTSHQLEKEQANHQPVKEQVRDYLSFSLNITKPREIRRLLTRNTPKLLNES